MTENNDNEMLTLVSETKLYDLRSELATYEAALRKIKQRALVIHATLMTTMRRVRIA